MALLGSSVDPRLFLQDYSGFTRAAEMNAQAMQGLGQNIGKAISDYGDLKKKQKKVDAYNKASAQAIEAGLTLGKAYGVTGVEESLRPFLDAASDPSLSPIEKAAALEQGKAMLPMVFGRYDRSQDVQIQDSAYKAKIEAAKAKQIAEASKPPTTLDVPVAGGVQKTQWDPSTQSFVPIRTTGVGLTDLVKEFEGFNPKAYPDYGQISIGYGTKGKLGEVLTEEEASQRLEVELADSAKRIEEAAALKGITLNENQFNALTSFDYNTGKGRNLISRFGDDPEALAAKMLEYTKAGGETLPGLVKRRQVEAALLLAPTKEAAIPSQVGFAPSDQAKQKQGTLMTPEQVSSYVAQGYKVSSIPAEGGNMFVTGIQSLSPQKGQETIINPDGTVTIRDIVTAAGAKQEAVAEAQKSMAERGLRISESATEEAFRLLDQVGASTAAGAKMNALVADILPGTSQGELKKQLEMIEAQNALGTVNELRKSSPTGGSIGNISEKEWPLLKARYFPLDINAKKDALTKGLSQNLLNTFEAVNGTPEEVMKAKEDGKITQVVYDNYINEYMRARDIARVGESGLPGRASDWTRLNKTLINKSTTFAAPSSGISISPAAQSVIDKYR